MSLVDAVKTCLSKYATFSGRARRPEFWWWMLFQFGALSVAEIIDLSMDLGRGAPDGERAGLLSSLVGLALFVPTLAVSGRRLHDTGRSARALLFPALVLLVSGVAVALSASGARGIGLSDDWVRPVWLLAGLAAAAAQVTLVVWLVSPSDEGENDYGEPDAPPQRPTVAAGEGYAEGRASGPLQAVRACLEKYAMFSGRARRPEYWWFWAATLLVGLIILIAHGLVFGPEIVIETVAVEGPDGVMTEESRTNVTYDSGSWGSVYGLLVFLPLLAAGWRRLHDSGRSGWLLFLPAGVFVLGLAALAGLASALGQFDVATGSFTLSGPPAFAGAAVALAALASWIVVLVWLASPSQRGPNRFGPEPVA